jgi:hypothetical protein
MFMIILICDERSPEYPNFKEIYKFAHSFCQKNLINRLKMSNFILK